MLLILDTPIEKIIIILWASNIPSCILPGIKAVCVLEISFGIMIFNLLAITLGITLFRMLQQEIGYGNQIWLRLVI